MASSSQPGTTADKLPPEREVEPPKLRPKPQAKGNVGAGKQYADKQAFNADVEAWEQERKKHKVLMAERKKALDKIRDRSGRRRDGKDETDNERRVRQRAESSKQLASHADREQQTKKYRKLLFWQQELAWQVGQPGQYESHLCMCRKRAGWDESWWRKIDAWLDDREPDGTDQWWTDFATYARASQTKQQSLYDAIGCINGLSSTEPLRRCAIAAKLIPDVRDEDPHRDPHEEELLRAELEEEQFQAELAGQLRSFAELYAMDRTGSSKLASVMKVANMWDIRERRTGPCGYEYKVVWSDWECNEWAHVWAHREHLPNNCHDSLQRVDMLAEGVRPPRRPAPIPGGVSVPEPTQETLLALNELLRSTV